MPSSTTAGSRTEPATGGGAAPVVRRRGPTPPAWLAALPALVVIGLFSAYPVVVMVANSLGLGQPPADGGPTLEHYARAFGSAAVRDALLNSLYIAVGSVLFTLCVAVPVVLRQAEDDRAGRGGATTDALLTLPIALPGIIIGFFAIVLTGRTGLLGLAWDGFSGLAYTFPGLLIAYLYFSLPRVLGPLRGAAATLDPSLPESARTLGASRPRVFLTVTLPLLLPAAIETSGTAIAVALGGYGTVATLSEGVRLLPLNVANELTTGYRLAASSTLAVILAATAVLALVLGRVLARVVRRAVAS
ncbi:putative spermidine/putrescine transport system permease protein [Nocardiopsis sp. L17-MgMaSL7]|nr:MULTISPECIES: ABC transporter permease subunit [Nocardiopsis]PWV55272.1 putative spermidine/putrescine transport system permease protein [Nocardiopsis sp. L17-MgMaSL7]